MAAFLGILRKGMAATPGGADEYAVPEALRVGTGATGVPIDLPQRVALLIQTTSLALFRHASQGLFERHKLLVAAQLCLATLRSAGRLHPAKLDFLLAGGGTGGGSTCGGSGGGGIGGGNGGVQGGGEANPVADWVSPGAWAAAVALRALPDYGALTEDLAASAKRWRDWTELERPEEEPLPGERGVVGAHSTGRVR